MINNYNHPARTAECIATLDLVSNGRVDFGTGESSAILELGGFDIPVESKREQYLEATEQIANMLAMDPYPGYEGKYFSMPCRNIVPKSVQKPHPPLFQPFASSENSIRWCAQEGVTAVLPPMHEKTEMRLSQLYAEESGRPLGDGVAFLRDILIADSDAEADAMWRDSSRFVAETWFEPFGFRRGMIDPDTGEYPSPEEMIDKGYVLVGTVDTVCKRMEALMSRLPVEWIFAWTFNGLVPNATILKSLELYQTKVLPKLGLSA